MTIKFNSNIAQFALLFSALLSLAGCQDQNLDQYQQEQLNNQLAKEQAASGVYKGSVSNQATGQSLGNIEFDLLPNASPSTSSTIAGSNGAQASLIGSVTIFQGAAISNKVDFDSIHYYVDDNSGVGTFTGSIQVPITGSTRSATLTVAGTINNGVFSGTIVNSPSEPIGAFRAVLGAGFPSADGQASSFSNDLASQQTANYLGQIPNLPGCNNKDAQGKSLACPVNVLLNVSYLAPTEAEAFLNNFEGGKTGTVTLKFVDPNNPSRVIANLAFPQAQIDLHGNGIKTSGNVGEVVANTTLVCVPSTQDSKSENCTMHTLSNGVTISFAVSPASAQ